MKTQFEMDNPMVCNIFSNLEKETYLICEEIKTFVTSTLKWADELEGIVGKEFSEEKDSGGLFLLPKTPCEKKRAKRKGKNAFEEPKISTAVQDEFETLDTSISTRTRRGRKAAVSQKPQSIAPKEDNKNISNDLPQENEVAEDEVKKVESAEETFVVKASSRTRTKPVQKNKKEDVVVAEIQSPVPAKRVTRNVKKSGKLEENVSSRSESNTPVPAKRKGKAATKASSKGDKISSKKASEVLQTPSEEPVSISSSNTTTPEIRNSVKKQAPNIVNEFPVVRLTRGKVTAILNQMPSQRISTPKVPDALNESSIISSTVIESKSPSPISRSSSFKSARSSSRSPASRTSKSIAKNNVSICHDSVASNKNSLSNRTITIKKTFTPKATSTFVKLDEPLNDTTDEEKTPIAKDNKFLRMSKTSTPAREMEKTFVAAEKKLCSIETNRYLNNSRKSKMEVERDHSGDVSAIIENTVEDISDNTEVPKKKRKLKKDEEVKENIEDLGNTEGVRITRTKSKALKKLMEENETKQTDFSSFAKKLLNKAMMSSMKKSQMAALLDSNSSTPKTGPGQLGKNLPFGNLTASKTAMQILSTTKKLKTPLGTLPNSGVKSGDKDGIKSKTLSRDSSVESNVRTVTKIPKPGLLDRENKLKSKKEKEKEAELKRQNVIKSKQEELKRKNEMKHQMALKQREKLEQEKYLNMIQSEKEKEERHNLILQERQMKLKEEAFKKKMMTQQKIAETLERRRLEEEARIAKLKEQEAEEQRLALEKQKEQERLEKRAQERLAEKKAREEYELQLKQEMEAERLKAEKLMTAKKCMPSATKVQSTCKRQKFGIIGEKREWDYKPRNENDYGLDDEHSEIESDDEKSEDKRKPAVTWAQRVLHKKSPFVKVITLEMLCEFMPCYQKSPDIHKMFKMTPTKRIKRTSSAIWNTPN